MNEKKVYFTDGTSECFYTAVFDAYKDENAYVTSEKYLQLSLGQSFVHVIADGEKVARVLNKIRRLDKNAVYDVELALRSRERDREQTAFLYVRELVRSGKSVRGKLSVSAVRRMMDLRSQVAGEVHRLKGFLRFSETADGVLYAPCSPDHDDVDLLAPHFIARLACPFVIHDVWRKKALLYDGRECVVMPVDSAEIVESDRQQAFSELWKKYYRTVNIPARKNVRQQKGYMPVRYWKFLNEMQGEK